MLQQLAYIVLLTMWLLLSWTVCDTRLLVQTKLSYHCIKTLWEEQPCRHILLSDLSVWPIWLIYLKFRSDIVRVTLPGERRGLCHMSINMQNGYRAKRSTVYMVGIGEQEAFKKLLMLHWLEPVNCGQRKQPLWFLLWASTHIAVSFNTRDVTLNNFLNSRWWSQQQITLIPRWWWTSVVCHFTKQLASLKPHHEFICLYLDIHTPAPH